MAQSPVSYKDPAWDMAEEEAAKRTGVPKEVLAAIRLHGEKSNADQVSPVGAKGVYQFMPKTERLFYKKYGVSAYSEDPSEQATAAAYHLKESYARTQDWGRAAAGYNGGMAGEKNPRFTKETSDYYDRITAALPEGIRTRIPGTGKVAKAIASREESGVPLARSVTWDDAWNGRLPEFATVAPDGPAPGVDTAAPFEAPGPVGASPLVPLAQASQAAQEAKEKKRQEQKRWGRDDRSTTMGAARSIALTPTANAIAHVYAAGELYDEAYIQKRKADPTAVYRYVENPNEDEKSLLASTQSDTDLALALTKIQTDREDRGVMANVSGSEALFMGALGGLSDPVGWAAGFGAMKAFQLAGIGATALAAAGRPALAGVSLAGENALGNVLSEAGLQALGERRTVEDYAMSALAGAGMSLPFLPSTVQAGHHAALQRAAREAYEREAPFILKAQQELGPQATVETIKERAGSLREAADKAEASSRMAAPKADRQFDAPDTETMLAREAEAPEAQAQPELQSYTGAETRNWNPDVKMGSDLNLESNIERYGITRSADEVRALTPGTHLDADTAAEFSGFSQTYKVLEALRSKYVPDMTLHVQRGTKPSGPDASLSLGPNRHAIFLTPGEQMQPTAVHELGHAIFEHYASRLDPALRSRMVADWTLWKQDFEAGGGRGAAEARMGIQRATSDSAIGRFLRGETKGSFRNAIATQVRENGGDPESYLRYFTKFDEYAAEQFVKHVENEVAKGAAKEVQGILTQLKNLIKNLLGFWKDAKKRGALAPSDSFQEFFEQAMARNLEEGSTAGVIQHDAAPEKAPAAKAKAEPRPVYDDLDMKHGLDTIDVSDVQGRMRYKAIKKLRKDAEAWLEANPQDPAKINRYWGNKLLGELSLPGQVLASSDDPLAKMYAALVVEDAMGAGGRHDTAAIRKFVIAQSLVGDSLIGFERELNAYAVGKMGRARAVADGWTRGDMQNQFNREVFTEIENRLHGRTLTQDGNVKRAADMVEGAMERNRKAQVDNKTAGWGALPETSVGYLPHRFNAAALMTLEPESHRALVAALRKQLVELNDFDDAFAERIAKSYIQHARTNAIGGHEIPGNLQDPAAAHYVEEAMRSQGMTRAEIQEYANKLRAGSMSHTKKRLKLDLMAEYAPGKKMLDLYHTDIPSLLKAQAERVAGEVALTQQGIMGSAGMKIIEDALSFKPTGMTQEAHKRMMGAFQQTAAEMLDRPWQPAGGGASVWADRAMQANTLSSLGGMGFAQLQEGLHLGSTLGISHAVSSLVDMPRLIGEVKKMARGEKVENSILNSMEAFGGGGEFGMADYKMVLKLDDPGKLHTAVGQAEVGLMDRVLRTGSHALNALSFNRLVMSVQLRATAEQITKKALRYIRDGLEDKALADMGFTPELIQAVRADLPNAAQWNGDALKSFDITQFKDQEAAAAFVTAVHRGSRQIIQGSFVGEKHKWQHTALGRIATQFRTFPLIAMEKQLGRNLAVRGAMGVIGMVLAMLPFAMMIQAGRVALAAAGRDDADKYIEERLSPAALARASFNYIGVLGLLPDLVNAATSMIPDSVDEALGGKAGGRYNIPNTTASVIPIVGWGDRVVKALTEDADKKVSPLVQLTPLNNTPLILPLSNLLKDMGK